MFEEVKDEDLARACRAVAQKARDGVIPRFGTGDVVLDGAPCCAIGHVYAELGTNLTEDVFSLELAMYQRINKTGVVKAADIYEVNDRCGGDPVTVADVLEDTANHIERAIAAQPEDV